MLDNQLLRLLLRDFNSDNHIPDLIWEAHTAGRLRHVSDRMASRLGAVEGVPLLQALLATRPVGAKVRNPGWEALECCMAGTQPFTDQVVALWLDGALTWWSLTAMPVEGGEQGAGWLGVARDVTQQKQQQDEIERQANFDSLTGLPSRYAFQRHMMGHIARGKSEDTFVLAHFDVNGFKAVNKIHGYPGGDAVLKVLAQRLETFVAPGITVGRLGGDDFVALLEMEQSNAEALLHEMLHALQAPIDLRQKPMELQICAGAVVYPIHADQMPQLFQNVGFALAAAKELGPGALCLYEREYETNFLHRVRTIHEIRTALDESQFEVWYQPQVDLHKKSTVGAEALIRWRHPERGLVSPVEFIPLAEESGQIVGLGCWVLFRACQEAVAWPEHWRVSVNVAPAQLQDRRFMEHVRGALAVSGLPARRLKLEITESALVDGNAQVLDILHELTAMGICVSLDDFGTGYSSLSYLRKYPFNELKIDQSFVRSMLDNDESKAIVATIMQLASSLHLGTIAEGVETPEQAALLSSIGCVRYQGYLYGRPMPLQQFVQAGHAVVLV